MKLFETNRSEYDDEAITRYQRCIQLLTRELLLSQSSDWGFLMLNEASKTYAEGRTNGHLENFDRVWGIMTKEENDEELAEIEAMNPIFADLPWNLFEPYQ